MGLFLEKVGVNTHSLEAKTIYDRIKPRGKDSLSHQDLVKALGNHKNGNIIAKM